MSSIIWTPESPPKRVTVYVDETLLDRGSGLIQVGLPIPDSGIQALTEAIKGLRAAFPRFQHTEFKASKLNAGNARAYTTFLKYVINVLGAVGDQSELRGVVTVEATERSIDHKYTIFLRSVEGAFAKLGVNTKVAPEFARQVGWLKRNIDHLCPAPIKNPFVVVVDEKYRDAEECESLKPTLSPSLGIAVWWETWKHLTTMLNYLLKQERKGRWTPKFTEFRFEKSEKSLYLQAADLLANLFYNALKFAKGIHDETTKMKNDVLRSVYDSPFPADLLAAFDVVVQTDRRGKQHQLLVLTEPAFSRCVTLLPYTLAAKE